MKKGIISLLLIFTFSTFALDTKPSKEGMDAILPVVKYSLPNGMTFLILRRTQAPVFSGIIRFNAGGVDEVEGNTGLAHLFEHMAFKGTTHIGTTDWVKEKPIFDEIARIGATLTDEMAKGNKADKSKIEELRKNLNALQEEERKYMVKNEFDLWYSRAGQQDLNAWTSKDETAYVVSLPSNAIELWMLMESQRLRDPVLREFYSERDVVAEERRMRYENNPFGIIYETLEATTFKTHPYRLPTIGWMTDIYNLTLEKAYDFYDKHYSLSNAVGVLVGDIDIEKTKVLLDKYFGSIPKRGDPPMIVTAEPEQKGEKRADVHFPANPMFMVAYHKPNWESRDDTVMDVISAMLTDGNSSRLVKSLVNEKGIAVSVNSENGDPGARYNNLILFVLVPLQPHNCKEVEDALYLEIDRFSKELPSESEVEKAKTKILARVIRNMQSNFSLAALLATYQGITGDWAYLEKYKKDLIGVTPAMVQETAKKYLTPLNRTVVTLVPSVEGGEVK